MCLIPTKEKRKAHDIILNSTSTLLGKVEIQGSHLHSGFLVIFVVGQRAPSQHKVTLLPVLHQRPLLFLEPAGLQGPLHGSGGAR